MLVYDKAYMSLRSKYLIPLTKYSVPYSHLSCASIKKVVVNKSTSIKIIRNNEYAFCIENDYLLKALLGEIEAFYIRDLIQKSDAEYCMGKGCSSNWNIVTNYYNAFFAASLLLRLCFRGNTYLDGDTKRDMEFMIATLTGSIVTLDYNQFFEVFEENGQYVLKLTQMKGRTHESLWKHLDVLLGELLLMARRNSDEYTLLSTIKQNNIKLGSIYPSQLRNKVNYQPSFGIRCIDKTLYPIDRSISWVKYLLNDVDKDNDNQMACYMYAFSKYIETLAFNLIQEYYLIKGNENGILKKFNSNRENKIEIEKPQYVF